jgi:hypothetical protein
MTGRSFGEYVAATAAKDRIMSEWLTERGPALASKKHQPVWKLLRARATDA